jgi:PAS domain S-box-containing protein
MTLDHPATPDFRALFESAPDLYMVLAPDFTIVSVSDAYCSATLITRGMVVGRNLFDIFPDNPDDPDATGVANLRASLMRVLHFRRKDIMATQRYDVRRPPEEGGAFEERHWAVSNNPVLDRNGEVMLIIHRAEDITDIVRIEEAARAGTEAAIDDIMRRLRGTSSFLDAVIENLPGMLFVKSARDHSYLLFNRAAEELLGYPRGELLGKSDHDMFPKSEADGYRAADIEALRSGKPVLTAEEEITTRHNGIRLLRTVKVPVMNEAGKPQFLLGFAEDITERKAIEQQLRQAMKMEAVGQLTGGVAHDFNNLLGIIIGNLDIAADHARGNAALRDNLQEALNAALRGAELTRRLLAFSRNQPLQPATFDLNQGLPQISKMLRRTLGEQVQVELHPRPDLWPVRADPAQLDEAILNLAINARDAMPSGGTLTIETANSHLDEDYASANPGVTAGDYVLLSVSDTGTGMSPEVAERCFEPFFTTKTAEKGSGLGLSMVYGFVKQSGGHIKVYSELGHGTSVKIYLPRVHGTATDAQRADGTAAADARGHEKVLVVEDNADLRAVMLKQISDLGYQTLEAPSGKAALEVLAAHPEIDLLFTDIIMPGGMTGVELARECRKLFPKVRILLTSGYTARAMANGFHEIEGLELLNKPFRKRDLAQKLRHILDKA